MKQSPTLNQQNLMTWADDQLAVHAVVAVGLYWRRQMKHGKRRNLLMTMSPGEATAKMTMVGFGTELGCQGERDNHNLLLLHSIEHVPRCIDKADSIDVILYCAGIDVEIAVADPEGDVVGGVRTAAIDDADADEIA